MPEWRRLIEDRKRPLLRKLNGLVSADAFFLFLSFCDVCFFEFFVFSLCFSSFLPFSLTLTVPLSIELTWVRIFVADVSSAGVAKMSVNIRNVAEEIIVCASKYLY